MDIFNAVPGTLLELGKTGTNGTRAWRFYVGSWVDEYPDGVIHVLHQRPGDDSPLPVSNTELTGDYVYWIISSSDVATAGEGLCEVLLMDTDDNVAKHEDYTTHITASASTTGTTPPDPEAGWVAQVLAAATNIEVYADAALAAKEAAETAQGKAEDAQDAAEDAQDAAEDAQEAAETAQGKAEDAQTAAETAQTAAEAAQSAAEAALAEVADYAADATNAAEAAADSVTDAEAAQSAAEDAKDAALAAKADAEDAASAAYTSAGNAATSASNASGYATTAGNAATAAATAKTAADADALMAEGYAVGKQNGQAVASGTYYHNNAKYYAECSAGAEAAQTAAETAQGKAEDAQEAAEAAQSAAEAAASGLTIKEDKLDGLSGVFFVNGTQIEATNAWTGSLASVKKPTSVNGMTILYRLPYKSVVGNSTTLTVAMDGGDVYGSVTYSSNENGTPNREFEAYSLILLTYWNGWRIIGLYHNPHAILSAVDIDVDNGVLTITTDSADNMPPAFKGYNLLRFNSGVMSGETNNLKLKIGSYSYDLYVNGSNVITAFGDPIEPGMYLAYYDGTSYYIRTDGFITGENATTSKAGLMSAADKTKLDGIATNANNYTLPDASSDTKGGVMIESTPTENSTKALTSGGAYAALASQGEEIDNLNSAISANISAIKGTDAYVGKTTVFDLMEMLTFVNGYYNASGSTPQGDIPYNQSQLASNIIKIGAGSKLAIKVPTGYRVYVQPFTDALVKTTGSGFLTQDTEYTLTENCVGFNITKNPYSSSDTISPSNAAGFEIKLTVTADVNNLTKRIQDVETKGLIYRGSIGTGDNINNITTIGAYYVALTDVSGTLPTGIVTAPGQGMLEVAGTGNYLTQKLTQIYTNQVYFRSEVSSGGWTAWVELVNTTKLSETMDKVLAYKRSIESTENINNITTPGAYYVTLSNVQGTLPDGIDTVHANGLLEVMGTGNFISQRLYHLYSGKVYVRSEISSGGWTTWEELIRKSDLDDSTVKVTTRNLWTYGDLDITGYKIIGTQGVTLFPSGKYTLSCDMTADESYINFNVYMSGGTITKQITPAASGRTIIQINATSAIERIFLQTKSGSSSSYTFQLEDVQFEKIYWSNYEYSDTSNWIPMPYTTPYVEHKISVNDKVAEYKSYWEGKKIVFNGDSITHGISVDGEGKVGYVRVACQLLKFGIVENYAIGGTRLAHVEGEANCLVDRLNDMPTDADIIYIMANTNDYASQVPIGTDDSSDTTTYKGALNALLDWLKTNYQQKPVIISTQLTRKINTSGGEPLPIAPEEYVQAVRDRVAAYHFILFDAYERSGMDLRTSPQDGTGITNDGLHPNSYGALLLGRKVAAFINEQ